MTATITHDATGRRAPRSRLLGALAVDALTLGAALCVSGLLATVWLLARTRLGRLDPSEGDAVLALALCAAAAPAWTASRWRGLLAQAPGTPRGARRLAWLLLHPASLPAWLWLTLSAAIPASPALAIAPLVATLCVLALALASGVRALLRPEATPLHLQLALARRRRA